MAPHSTLASSDQQSQRQAQVFEFTKRKKWADILISELPDTVLLVLDAEGDIQYVGPNTTEVLGWEAEDLSKKDVLDLINDVDKGAFNNHLQKSIGSRQDLSCYARMKCKPLGKTNSEQGANQKELLFEIRGHPLYLQDDNECKGFFLVAKPYPSRNMAVLNTFLELKIENERLTQRLKDLKAQQDVIPGAINDILLPVSPSTMSHHQFATFEFPSTRDGTMQSPSTASTNGSFSAIQTGFVNSTGPGTNAGRDEEGEEGGKKKKQKKGNGQQYVCVTCGRTDSPEWRKGPRGPKTLCNACGLRWAKRSKRTDDVPIPYVQGQQQQQQQQGDGTSTSSSGGGSSSRNTRGAPVPNAALSVTPPMTSSETQPVSVSVSSSGPGGYHQRQEQTGRVQGQNHQGHGSYETFTQLSTTPSPISPTLSAFPPSHNHSHQQSQAQLAFSPTSTSSGHYAHPMIPISIHQQQHQQQGINMAMNMQQPGLSQTSVHSHGQSHAHGHTHGYMHPHPTQPQPLPQSQSQHAQVQQQQHDHAHGREHYQPVYDQLQWSMGQRGEGSYQY